MTTTAANSRTVFTRDLMYQVFRRSVWINICNRNWESDFAGASSVKIPDISAGAVSTETRTRTQLETGPTFSTSTITNVTLDEKFIRGYASIPMADIKSTGPGPTLESRIAEEMAIEMAIELDDRIAAAVAALTFDEVNGSGNDNKVIAGTAGSVFIDRTAPYTPTGTDAVKLVVNAVKLAHMYLFRKNVVAGLTLGAGEPSPLAVVLPPELCATVVDYLETTGELTDRASIAGQAGVSRGILGTAAYMGTYAGADFAASNSLAVPTGTNNWLFYILPTTSALAAAVEAPDIDEASYGQGNTAGAYVYRRTAISKYGIAALRPAHIFQAEVHSD